MMGVDVDERAAIFEGERDRLFGLAYRMLGSVADAEDLLQEAFLRFAGAAEVRAAGPFLTTVVTRLAVDHLRSARVRRESYVGPWLPEPLVGEAPDAAQDQELAESLSLAFLQLLEVLTPAERAAYVLHDVLGLPFAELAPALERTPESCRQLASRARRRLRGGTTRFPGGRDEAARLAGAFFGAVRGGELDALIATLREDVVLWSDGGGKVPSALRPIHGARNVARFLLGIAAKAPPDVAVLPTWVNGRPGVMLTHEGAVRRVIGVELDADGVAAIHVIGNPDKLAHLAPGPTAAG
ncbi:MAG: RNA polymerase sigma factor SigJ [Myxococcota bacterium]